MPDPAKPAADSAASRPRVDFPYGTAAILSLSGLIAAGGIGAVAINVGGGAAPKTAERVWGDKVCFITPARPGPPQQTLCFPFLPKPGMPNLRAGVAATLGSIHTKMQGGSKAEEKQWTALVTLPLSRPVELGEEPVGVTVRYRLSQRNGWANAQITGIPIGDCDIESADRERLCGRWYASPGAQDGAGELRMWMPASQIREKSALNLWLKIQVTTRRHGALRVSIDQVEVIQ